MIDKNSSLPLYHQIMQELKQQINDKKYEPNQVMPSEAELMRIYGVSRMTVRLAIDGLERQGYVTKVQGKGTFVKKRKIVQELSMITSWSESLLSQGLNTQSEILAKKEVKADEDAAEKLGVAMGTPLYYVERIKSVDHEPVGWGRIWVKKSLFPGILEQENLGDSVYDVMENIYHVEMDRAVEVVEAMAADKRAAALLGIREGEPLLQVNRVTYNTAGEAIEISRIVSRADMYAYRMELHGRKHK